MAVIFGADPANSASNSESSYRRLTHDFLVLDSRARVPPSVRPSDHAGAKRAVLPTFGLGKQPGDDDDYQRALAILKKALGPDHSHVATALENHADMLRETGRDARRQSWKRAPR